MMQEHVSSQYLIKFTEETISPFKTSACQNNMQILHTVITSKKSIEEFSFKM